jgi:TPP-dependent pyruvate/acetoin dehydrogenase alpha subunit
MQRGVKQQELDAIGERATQEVQQAVDRARAAPRPDAATVLDDVYCSSSLNAIPG